MELNAYRLQAAADALASLLTFEHPADQTLRRFFREHPALGQRDRAFVAETCFAVLRNLRLLRELSAAESPRPLLLAALTLLEGMSLRQLEPVLRRGEREQLERLRAADRQALSVPARLSLPDWLWERLCAAMPEAEASALARGLLEPAPLDLRVNTVLASRDSVIEQFRQGGIAAEATPFSPVGVRLADKPALQSHPLFLQGAVEVQDEASQLLTWLVAPRRREMVVDFCAGAGGKTLALGAMMRSEGRVYAFDTSERRLANLKPRLKRSGLSNVTPQHIDSENDARIKRLAGKIDRVLVDAPCSGLGTLRRNPDLKWRQSPESVLQMSAKQAAILEAAARLVKPGGRLVYATCSLLPEENDRIVDAFLERHSAFAALDCSALLAQQKIALDTGPRLRVFPHTHGMDGFFAAAMEKSQDPGPKTKDDVSGSPG
jgi:16S rRNA (cytosine967-C5)-methyltransferase